MHRWNDIGLVIRQLLFFNFKFVYKIWMFDELHESIEQMF